MIRGRRGLAGESPHRRHGLRETVRRENRREQRRDHEPHHQRQPDDERDPLHPEVDFTNATPGNPLRCGRVGGTSDSTTSVLIRTSLSGR